jgi:hypothetical protein
VVCCVQTSIRAHVARRRKKMIEGLKLTFSGEELRTWALASSR